jgi:hypothetical protein
LIGEDDVRKSIVVVLLIWIGIEAALSSVSASAKEVETNQIHTADAPKWVTMNRLDRIVNHIQTLLEWDIRKIEVKWYKDQAEFEKMHGLGKIVMAVSKKPENTVYLGPKVVDSNFDQTLGHELVHIISYQKYHTAIPKWLEEGLANYLAKMGTVDYKWLASRPFPADVRELDHPIKGSDEEIRYHYKASQALVEMIVGNKCDLTNLLRLSVERKMEDYISTYCEIKDLNASYRKWVTSHAPGIKQADVK